MTERGMAWKEALGSDACPDLDELFRVLSEEKPVPELQEHLQRCPRCATEAALYREFEAGTLRPGEEADVAWIVRRLAEQEDATGSPARASVDETPVGRASSIMQWLAGVGWRTWAPLAAAVLLAVILGTWRSSLPEVGDISEISIVRAGRVELIRPVGELGAPPNELGWEKVPGAVRYSVRVLEVDRNVLWQAETSNDSVSLPSSVRGEMTVGRRFLWEVTALDAAGSPIGGTGSADFEIRAERGGR